MDLLEGVAIASPSVALNYVLSSVLGVGVSYYFLCQLFEKRVSSFFFWAYFIAKSMGDVYLWYALGNGGAGTWIESLHAMWTSSLAVISLVVVFATFRGSFASVGICSIICDLFAGVTTSSSWAFTNAVMGEPFDRGFLIDVSPHLLLYGALVVLVTYLVRAPALWLLRWLCRLTRQHWALSFAITLVFVASMALVLPRELADVASSYPVRPYIPCAFALFACLWVLLWLSSRDAALRAQVMAACAELARQYERVVREQLRTLDRDRLVLEGHERALVRLGREEADSELSARIRELERSYRRLSVGLYCDQPALDAVLTAGANRLRALGVVPVFTVAARSATSAMTALALLNLAGDAAAHVDGAEGAEVELRIRGVGERLLFRLEVPVVWGLLGAQRLLRPVIDSPSTLVRERKRGDRRVVLVLTPAEGETTCTC